jgi:hypothetical protein
LPPASFAFAKIAAVLAGVELAAVIAAPLPVYAEGGVSPRNEKGLINDAGRQEYIERDGQLLTTTQANAVVDLKKGDVIHKNFEELRRKTMLLSLINGGESMTEKDVNLAFGIKEEIKEGFRKATVSNKVTVLNKNNSYRDKMSMWE